MKLQTVTTVLVALLGWVVLGPSPGRADVEKRLLEERSFRLEKHGRDQALLSVGEAGVVLIKVQVKKPLATLPIRLLLEGPDGLQVEKQDAAPLRLRYPIDRAQAKATWRVSVTNVSNMGPVTGQLTVELEPGSAVSDTSSAGGQPSKAQDIDGRVRFVNDQKIRASCRDKNLDVSVRLDMESGTGAFSMSFNPVFTLAAVYTLNQVIEMRGSGEHPLYLDLDRRLLYFASGEEAIFCRVRLFLGEGG